MVLFGRAQGFPPFAVHSEDRTAINERCFRPWVMFQSTSKKVDLVSDPGGVLCKATASAISL